MAASHSPSISSNSPLTRCACVSREIAMAEGRYHRAMIEPVQGEPPSELEPAVLHRMREAGSEELLALVREHAALLDPPAVRAVLRSPFVTAEVIESLARPRLLSFYEVRRDLALHPRTPQALAQQLVPGLWWRDLA